MPLSDRGFVLDNVNQPLPPKLIQAIIDIELHPDITDEAIQELADIILIEALQYNVCLTDVDEYLYAKRNDSIRIRKDNASNSSD